MFRTFTLALSATYTSIWDLLVAAGFDDSLGNMLVSAVKNQAIIPDRVQQLDVRAADGNSGDVTYRDNQADPGVEQKIPTTGLLLRSNRNSICLKTLQFAGNANSISVSISAI